MNKTWHNRSPTPPGESRAGHPGAEGPDPGPVTRFILEGGVEKQPPHPRPTLSPVPHPLTRSRSIPPVAPSAGAAPGPARPPGARLRPPVPLADGAPGWAGGAAPDPLPRPGFG